MRSRSFFLALAPFVFAAGFARADITAHNGIDGDGVTGGTGAVQVTLTDNSPGPEGIGILDIAKEFKQIQRHELDYLYNPGKGGEPPLAVLEVVQNNSVKHWFEFHIKLFNADFLNAADVEPIANGDINFSPIDGMMVVQSSSITRVGDDATLSIYFWGPNDLTSLVDAGESFELGFTVDGPAPGFSMHETPVVPEPASLALFAIGALVLVRRAPRLH